MNSKGMNKEVNSVSENVNMNKNDVSSVKKSSKLFNVNKKVMKVLEELDIQGFWKR